MGLRSSQTAYHHLTKLEAAGRRPWGEGRRDQFRYDEEATVEWLNTEENRVRRRAEDVRIKGRGVYVVHPRATKA